MLAFSDIRISMLSSWRAVSWRAGSIRTLGLFLVVLSSTIALIASSAPPAQAAEVDDEAAFVARINSLRSEQGLAPLAIDTELVTASRQWAVQLSQNGVLSHAPDLSVGVTSQWAKLGENVGVADSDQFDQLFNAFVNSPSHYANLVDASFTHIGTGVVYDGNGRMWTTHRFMAKIGATTTTAPPASSSTTSDTIAVTSSSTTVTTVQGSGPTATTGTTTTQESTTSTSEPQASSTSSTTASPDVSQPEDGRPILKPIPAKPVDPELLTFLFTQLAKTG